MNMESLINYIKEHMNVEAIEYDINYARITGSLNEPIQTTMREIDSFAKTTGYTVLYGRVHKSHVVRIGIVLQGSQNRKLWLHLLLFLATVFTTLWAGAQFEGGNPLVRFDDLWLGIPFSLSLMAILTGHELGHYFVSRKMGMITSLPFFIPVPPLYLFSPGTFGAVIRTRSIIPDRKSLLLVGLSGPLTGFLIALPITIIGLSLSQVQPVPTSGPFLVLGDSLLFYLIGRIIHPGLAPGMDIYLNSVALAGWLGFLITGLNLLPIGQLDGGHVAYAVLFDRRKILYVPLALIMLGCGLLLWPGWIFWAVLAFFMSRRDPLIKDALTPLTLREKLLALIPLVILILTFIPKPLSIGYR